LNLYRSYGKINIGLRIVSRRRDGYHNLESIFQEITLFDEILIKKREAGIRIRTDCESLPVDENNLCYQAYQHLVNEYGLKVGVEVEIIKNIPIGSGLGGGSSNAATCLKAFNDIFELGLSRGELIRLGAKIGSDVPFFIVGKTALVKGRGEVVIPIRFLSDYQLLIIFPQVQVSTAFIYKNFEFALTKSKWNVKFEAVISRVRTLDDLSTYFSNDLEDVARKYYPEIAEVHQGIVESGARFVSLSGSGSAVYGIYPADVDLDSVRKQFIPRYQVFIARPIV